MTAKVVIHLDAEALASRVSIPAGAVLADAEGRSAVWLVDPQTMKVSRVPVELGDFSGDSVEVVSGLEPGQEIAVSGVHNLRDGMEVRRYQGTPGRRGE